MKRKQLEIHLQKIKPFQKAKVKLEQYPTPPNLATEMMFTIENSFGDLDGKFVCDLGCGSGMLTIASSLLGASFVMAIDIDPSAIEDAKENISIIFDECGDIDFLNCSVENIPESLHSKFDTVIMNPPFGTKIKGIDIKFLEIGSKLSTNSIYSLHKTSTREYIQRNCKELNLEGKVVAEMKVDLPKTMKFHKKDNVEIEVDFWRFNHIKKKK
eukprot:TRINITY_DN14022_c0_g1_i1.p1 TRINITY_DN14022_c0_g1~~TRINITY_DN14022_c0_g1_i1.p1  ORF type:complete len:213 (-),score=50.69 TRINITY_DN14022_c0_g1_i1:31-669(-)